MSPAFIAPPQPRGMPAVHRALPSISPVRRLLAALLLGSTTIGAHASSATPAAPSWTPTSLNQALRALPTGDAARGKALHAELQCASCHGSNGNATTRN